MISLNYKMMMVSALVAGGLSVSGCATKGYVNDQVGVVNTRVDGTDYQAGRSRPDQPGSAEARDRRRQAGRGQVPVLGGAERRLGEVPAEPA
jgi:peptidoglycan-associated lipoprotein